MDVGLFIAASGMVAQQAREDQLSNDLANASTPGYKPDSSASHSFDEVLMDNVETNQPLGTVSLGVSVGKPYTDMTPGSMQTTNEPLDFGIVGTGFFAVRTAQGVRYTRDGQFSESAQGLLVDSQGDEVLSQTGAPIKVQADGTVAASAVGAFNVPNAEKQGENLFSGAAAGRAGGTVRTGVLEESGVDPVKAMVEMVGSMRTFQSDQQSIQAIDQTLQAASTQVGSLTES